MQDYILLDRKEEIIYGDLGNIVAKKLWVKQDIKAIWHVAIKPRDRRITEDKIISNKIERIKKL